MITPIQCFIGQVVILLVWYLICALLYPIIKNKKQINKYNYERNHDPLS